VDLPFCKENGTGVIPWTFDLADCLTPSIFNSSAGSVTPLYCSECYYQHPFFGCIQDGGIWPPGESPSEQCGAIQTCDIRGINEATVYLKRWIAAPYHWKWHHYTGMWWDRFPNSFALGSPLMGIEDVGTGIIDYTKAATEANNAFFGCRDITQKIATWYADPSKTGLIAQMTAAGATAAELAKIIGGVNGLHVLGTVFNTMEFAVDASGMPWYANRRSTPSLKLPDQRLYLGVIDTKWQPVYDKIHYHPTWYFVEGQPLYGVTTGDYHDLRIPIPGHPYYAWTDAEKKDWAGNTLVFPPTIAPDGKDAFEVVADFASRIGWATMNDRPIGIGISPCKAGDLLAVIRVNEAEEFYIWRRTNETFSVKTSGDAFAECLSFEDQTSVGYAFVEQLRGAVGGRKLTAYKVTPTLTCETPADRTASGDCIGPVSGGGSDECFFWPVRCILVPGTGGTALDNDVHVMGSKEWAFSGSTTRVARRGMIAYPAGMGTSTRNKDQVEM